MNVGRDVGKMPLWKGGSGIRERNSVKGRLIQRSM